MPVNIQSTSNETPVEEATEIITAPASEEDTESSDDEEDGMKKKRKALAPKLRTTLLRKAHRAKRAVAYE